MYGPRCVKGWEPVPVEVWIAEQGDLAFPVVELDEVKVFFGHFTVLSSFLNDGF